MNVKKMYDQYHMQSWKLSINSDLYKEGDVQVDTPWVKSINYIKK